MVQVNSTCKRFISVFMIGLLMVTLISACGQSNSPVVAPKPNDSQKQSGNEAAQPKFPTALKEIAIYEGSDRHERLVESAKKEGELSLYGSPPIEDLDKLAEGFTKKYGVKVTIWRSGSENILQRVLSEAKAGISPDVILNNAPELEAMHREKVLQEVKSPYLKEILPEAIPSHKEWIGAESLIFTQAYNTNKVKKEELPKTYEDLLDPKWKGRLSIEAEDINWFAMVVRGMGEEKGLKFFRDLVAKNGLNVRKGHSLLAELVSAGEVDLALTVFNYKAQQLKESGRPLEWFAISPALIIPMSIGVLKNAKHPNAAVLFFDYMLNDGQQTWSDLGHSPTNIKIKSKLNDMPLKAIDPAILMDDNGKWTKLWNEIIINKK